MDEQAGPGQPRCHGRRHLRELCRREGPTQQSSRAAAEGAAKRTHAAFEPPPQSARQASELVPIRCGRTSEAPFRFHRGGAVVTAADLAETPRSGFSMHCSAEARIMGLLVGPPTPFPARPETGRVSASARGAGKSHTVAENETGDHSCADGSRTRARLFCSTPSCTSRRTR
ncbi:DUF2252 domain-containing protein [Streptomyces sp. NBC_01431]